MSTGRGRSTRNKDTSRSSSRKNDSRKSSSAKKKSSSFEKEDRRKTTRGKYADLKSKSSESSKSFSKPLSLKERVQKSEELLKKQGKTQRKSDGKIRLNKFISNAGICSRREADQMIKLGVISVNGEIVQEVGIKINPTDEVKYDGAKVSTAKLQYVLLNKPKNFTLNLAATKNTKSVMELVSKTTKEEIFPVGKMDKQGMGLLLLTNDADLIKKLERPKHGFPQLFHVVCKEKVKTEHMDLIREGLELDDGFVKVNEIAYASEGTDHRQIGVQINTGKNNIVRRMFEYFGYTITKLDRVMYGSLTKKDLPRGYSRLLTEREIGFLKMIS